MDTITLVFLIVGAVGVALLLLSFLLGDLGGPDMDGPFSLPAIAGFVGGGGFVGAIPAALLLDVFPDPDSSTRLLISVLIGLAAAFPIAWGVIRLARGLMNMRTDRTLTQSDLLGASGSVITAIPADGLGEVSLHIGGERLKYSARSQQPLPSGTPIYVINTLSATAVEVISTELEPPASPSELPG